MNPFGRFWGRLAEQCCTDLLCQQLLKALEHTCAHFPYPHSKQDKWTEILAATFFSNMNSDLIPSERNAHKSTECIPVFWLKKIKVCTSLWFFQTFLSVKQKSWLGHRLLKMGNVYLPLCLLVFKRMGPEDNEIQEFSCLLQSVGFDSKSKLKKLCYWKLCFVSLNIK